MNLGIEILMYLCEYLIQLMCVHALLGKKIKVDIKLLSFGSMFIGILLCMIHFGMSSVFTICPHIIMFLYILLEFKIKVIEDITIILLNILVTGSIQVIASLPVSILFDTIDEDRILLLLINFFSLIVMILITKVVKFDKVFIKVVKWDRSIIKILCIVSVIFLYLFISYKLEEDMEILAYFISALMICIVVKTVLNWQKDREEVKKKNFELHVYELYGNAFEGMIENIRIRQHDFKNQIAAIYGMHLTSESFEELVEKQKKYCDYLLEESRYDSILTKCNDKILAGFLYTKFAEWEKKGINFQFDIVFNNPKCSLATYELIEVSGILIDNAAEYEMEHKIGECVEFILKDTDEKVIMICRNLAEYITMEEVNKFFKKGYSTKGENRGLGLYNVKKILEGKGEIMVSNENLHGEKMIEFIVEIYRN